MIDYQVVSNVLVRKAPEARVLSVMISLEDTANLTATAEQLIAELRGSTFHLELYLYIEAQAVAWSGWIAHVTVSANRKPTIDTTNDPELRRAVYEAFQEDQTR